MVKEYFKGIYENRYILISLLNRDLQSKYRKSVMGIAWAVITPLGLVLIIGGVYSIIFGADPKEFIPNLFAGLTPWIFISSTAELSTGAFLNAEGYLKQTSVKSQIFPIRGVLVNFVNFLYSALAYFSIYLILQPDRFGPKMLMIIPSFFILFIFALSWANFSSIINLIVRDFQPLQSLVLQGLFYITPIIFSTDMLSDKGFALIYLLNPLYYVIEIIKVSFIGLKWPTLQLYGTATAISFSLFYLSIRLQMHYKEKIVFKL